MFSRPFLKLASCFALLFAAATAADLKFGYVDVDEVMAKTSDARAAKAQLAKWVAETQQRLDAERDGIVNEQAELEKAGASLSAEARRAKQAALEQRSTNLMENFQRLQVERSEREQRLMQPIVARINQLIAEMAQIEGLTVVFHRNALAYAPPGLDITNAIARRYEQKFTPAKSDGKK